MIPRDTRHRHQAGAGDLARPRRATWPVLAAVAAALAVLIALAGSGRGQTPAVGSPSASPAASPAAMPVGSWTPTTQMIVAGHATIVITDEGMMPEYFESAVGRDVSLTVVNTGSRTHNFTMAAFDIDVDLGPDEATTIQIDGPPLGTYPYSSGLPGDEHFEGTMTVFI